MLEVSRTMVTPNKSNLSSLIDGHSQVENVVDSIDTKEAIYIFGEVLIALGTIFGNSLVLAAILREPRLKTINNYFIANLAVADLLVGLVGIPCALLPNLGKPDDFSACLFVNSVIIILTQISIFGLLAIAMERFVAIKYPFQYKAMCSGKRVIAVTAIVWVAGIAVGALPLLGWNKIKNYNNTCGFTEVIDMKYMVYFNFFGCVLIPLLIMFGIYCYIFHIVKKQVAQISALHQAGVTAIAYSHRHSRQDEKLLSAAQKQAKESFSKETKAAKWFAVVILVFALCWLPLHIINLIIVVTGSMDPACMLAAILLSHTNSAINPVLYAYANAKFKTVFKRMLGCERKKQGDQEKNSNSPRQSFSMNQEAVAVVHDQQSNGNSCGAAPPKVNLTQYTELELRRQSEENSNKENELNSSRGSAT